MRLVKIRGFRDREIRFDFPVTALVGPNGAGKTTILGAAGLIYEKVRPRQFFVKSGAYDNSMKGWRVEYNLIDTSQKTGSTRTRTASYLRAKWNRDAVKRDVAIIGIARTLPASERNDMYRFARNDFTAAGEISFDPPVLEAVRRILGKDAENYLKVAADKAGKAQIFALRDEDRPDENYSEFHFGAGEASIIRIVSKIEETANDSLILIEEIENGLHPVATRRLVEYLIDVARRKSCQIIFTTHSNDALAPLPTDAVWSSYKGRLTQGKLDVSALRTLTGQIDAQLAIFTEDRFDEMFADVTLRAYAQRKSLDRSSIRIHALGGSAPARDHTRFHNGNPTRTFPAVCLLDGDMRHEGGYVPLPLTHRRDGVERTGVDIVYAPGLSDPEEHVFSTIRSNMESGNLIGKLTLALQLDTPMQSRVRSSIIERGNTNRDRHLIYAQIGEDLDFLSETVVQRAFVTTWAYAFPDEVDAIWGPVQQLIPEAAGED
ncbi:putative ATPase [Micromonospora echinospora]|uniref:ATPase n=1 Tax=Micromonospora echinospora TaxID=1877 RepID=A0ABR6MDV8_MICEC|nr:AAA family ATPase [Micromonospora echinospora]MBB5113558.1 putative ATPase [Micromonospora echinospora]